MKLKHRLVNRGHLIGSDVFSQLKCNPDTFVILLKRWKSSNIMFSSCPTSTNVIVATSQSSSLHFCALKKKKKTTKEKKRKTDIYTLQWFLNMLHLKFNKHSTFRFLQMA